MRGLPFGAGGSSVLRVYRLEQFLKDLGIYPDLNYCGRSSFTDLEAEVPIAKRALERVAGEAKWRLFGRFSPPEKKAMFVRKLSPSRITNSDLPIYSLQTYHAYCNFRAELGHENAKLTGTLSQFAEGSLLNLLISKGIAEIWFADASTRLDFESMPPLKRHASIFRTL